MTYRSILVHVARTSAHDDAIGVAAALAAETDALLIGISAGFPAVPPVADGMSAAVIADVIEEERALLDEAQRDAEKRFRRLAGGTSNLAWRGLDSAVADAIATESRAADLIVLPHVPSDIDSDVLLPADPGDVLMAAARPLLLPAAGTTALPRGPVLLAWKDSGPSRRAMLDALPLMKRAEHVVVLGVDDDSQGTERMQTVLDDVAVHLGRHGLKATARVAAAASSDVTDDILAVAAEIGAGLVVAGGFGRSRVREWVFGGVTRSLLKQNAVSCLLSH